MQSVGIFTRTEVAPASKVARVEKPNNFAGALSAAFSARHFMAHAAAIDIRKLNRRWQMTAARRVASRRSRGGAGESARSEARKRGMTHLTPSVRASDRGLSPGP